MLPHICEEMSFEISDELVHATYLARYTSVIVYIKDIYEQSTNAYKYINSV